MRPEAHRAHKLGNFIQSALLVLAMAGMAAVCAATLWGLEGVIWAFVAVALILLFTPSIPSAVVLSLYRARPLGQAAFPEGHAILAELAARAGLPAAPRLYYLPSATLNAFSVGNAGATAIAVSDGMLRALNRRELIGVLAHEVSHIRNKDLRIMNLADVLSRVTSWFSYVGIFLLFLNLPLMLGGVGAVPWLLVAALVLAPTAVSLLQLALSRSREYDADLGAVALTGDAVGLASALRKLARLQGRFWEDVLLPGRRIPDPSLLRTHPPTEERIRRLLELAPPATPPLPAQRPRGMELPAGFGPVHPPRWRWPGVWY